MDQPTFGLSRLYFDSREEFESPRDCRLVSDLFRELECLPEKKECTMCVACFDRKLPEASGRLRTQQVVPELARAREAGLELLVRSLELASRQAQPTDNAASNHHSSGPTCGF